MNLSQKLTFAKIISKKFGLSEKDVRSKIDEVVEEIVLELSKGTTITHAGAITFTPVIREIDDAVAARRGFFKGYEEDYIGMRTTISPKLYHKLKNHKLNNLDLL